MQVSTILFNVIDTVFLVYQIKNMGKIWQQSITFSIKLIYNLNQSKF